jgi:hypothetical protein
VSTSRSTLSQAPNATAIPQKGLGGYWHRGGACQPDEQRAKRLRTHQPGAAPNQAQLPGRDQLLLKSPELQSRLGQRYCDESELLPLLLSQGLVGRVRAIEVAVHPLGGDNFKIRLNSAKPSVGGGEGGDRLCAGD